MGNVVKTGAAEFEASILSVSDGGEAEIQLAGGARLTLVLSAEQLSSYRQCQVRERARAGTLGVSVRAANEWPAQRGDDDELVLGDRNWFYC